MKKSKIVLLGVSLLTLGVMATACGNKNVDVKSDNSSKVAKSDKTQATSDAKTVLDYIYKGKTSGVDKVTNQSAKELDDYLLGKLESKQSTSMSANGNLNDYFLLIDGSEYHADDIIKDYSKAYLDKAKQIGDYTVKSVDVTGESAKVTVSIKPIAGLSEANPIGDARTRLFGGIDEDTFIRQSQNKDLKTIKQLITLKLYAIYYGDLAHTPEKSNESVDVTFNMTKKGNSFMVDNDTVSQLAKDSRASVYAKD